MHYDLYTVLESTAWLYRALGSYPFVLQGPIQSRRYALSTVAVTFTVIFFSINVKYFFDYAVMIKEGYEYVSLYNFYISFLYYFYIKINSGATNISNTIWMTIICIFNVNLRILKSINIIYYLCSFSLEEDSLSVSILCVRQVASVICIFDATILKIANSRQVNCNKTVLYIN